MKTGHFTQVVWKNSTQVGFGVAVAPNGSFYAVANYYPAGNFTGQFKENVLQPTAANKKKYEKANSSVTRSQPSVKDKESNKSIEEPEEKKSGCC
jgi:hypothetical protein